MFRLVYNAKFADFAEVSEFGKQEARISRDGFLKVRFGGVLGIADIFDGTGTLLPIVWGGIDNGW